jgi:TonB-dependent SusC/RagA subfamily outer membrane receptor
VRRATIVVAATLLCAVPLRGQATTTKVQADSVIPAAPVSTLSQLLNARVPGVVVQSFDGSVGAGEQVYVRGSSQPLLVIDGVRVDNDPGGDNPAAADHPAPARFDDIDPAEIERVVVLPGAAAAALYGPEAGNGVILVTTRRGTAKKSTGQITLEGAEVSTPNYLPESYYAWGHEGGTSTRCLTYLAAAGQCTLDSVTHFDPFASASTTPLTTADQVRIGGNLDGSTETQRLWIGGHWASDPGTLQMPSADKALYAQNYGYSAPGSATLANREQEGDIRVKYGFDVGKKADVDLSVGYMSQYQRDPSLDALLTDAASGSGYQGTNDGWEDSVDRAWYALSNVARENTRHLNGGITVGYRPSTALALHLTGGLDNVDQTAGDVYTGRPTIFQSVAESGIDYNRTNASGYTVDAGGTFTKGDSVLQSQTTFGLQYLSRRFHDSTYQSTTSSNEQTVTAGLNLTAFSQDRSAYGREALTVANHLVLAGGARYDQQRYRAANLESWSLNPNLDASLAIIGSAADPRLRIRGAMGQTTTLPNADLVGALFALDAYSFSACEGIGACGAPTTVYPERQREWETGFDASLPHDRFTIGFSIYARRSVHELVPELYAENLPLAPDALVTDRGLEFTTSVKLVDNPSFAWDIGLDASENTDKVLRNSELASASNGSLEFVHAGLDHPVYGVYREGYTYSDANHDGVLSPNDVTPNGLSQYVGSAVPTHLASASMSVQMFKRHLRLATLFDYRGGYVLPDVAADAQGFPTKNAGAINQPGASLSQQAAAIATQYGILPVQRVSAVRWRELSATIGAPGAKSIQLTFAVRNLALWTKYAGDPDWEVTGLENSFFGTPALQLPEPRTLLLRLTFGL